MLGVELASLRYWWGNCVRLRQQETSLHGGKVDLALFYTHEKERSYIIPLTKTSIDVGRQ